MSRHLIIKLSCPIELSQKKSGTEHSKSVLTIDQTPERIYDNHGDMSMYNEMDETMYVATRMNVATWMNLKGIILKERSQTQNSIHSIMSFI